MYRPLIWALRPSFTGILGTLKGPYRVCSRYIRIPRLRAHTRAHGFNVGFGVFVEFIWATFLTSRVMGGWMYGAHLSGPYLYSPQWLSLNTD